MGKLLMTVAELIDELRQWAPEMEVATVNRDNEQGDWLEEIGPVVPLWELGAGDKYHRKIVLMQTFGGIPRFCFKENPL